MGVDSTAARRLVPLQERSAEKSRRRGPPTWAAWCKSPSNLVPSPTHRLEREVQTERILEVGQQRGRELAEAPSDALDGHGSHLLGLGL